MCVHGLESVHKSVSEAGQASRRNMSPEHMNLHTNQVLCLRKHESLWEKVVLGRIVRVSPLL